MNRNRVKINWTFDRKAARRKFGYKRKLFKRSQTQPFSRGSLLTFWETATGRTLATLLSELARSSKRQLRVVQTSKRRAEARRDG
jgi:hypothetical protein